MRRVVRLLVRVLDDLQEDELRLRRLISEPMDFINKINLASDRNTDYNRLMLDLNFKYK